jgi:hypothetical protein
MVLLIRLGYLILSHTNTAGGAIVPMREITIKVGALIIVWHQTTLQTK